MKKYTVEFKNGGFCFLYAACFCVSRFLSGYPFRYITFMNEKNQTVAEFMSCDLKSIKEYRTDCGNFNVWQNNL